MEPVTLQGPPSLASWPRILASMPVSRSSMLDLRESRSIIGRLAWESRFKSISQGVHSQSKLEWKVHRMSSISPTTILPCHQTKMLISSSYLSLLKSTEFRTSQLSALSSTTLLGLKMETASTSRHERQKKLPFNQTVTCLF